MSFTQPTDFLSPEAAARVLDQLADWIRTRAPNSLDPGIAPQRRSDAGSVGTPWLSCEQAAMLASAEIEYGNRRARDRILPKEWVGEPGWDILLQLFICRLRRTKASVTNISMASQSSFTTALRYISGLENSGFIVRSHSPIDQRVKYLELSDAGLEMMEKVMRRRIVELAAECGETSTCALSK